MDRRSPRGEGVEISSRDRATPAPAGIPLRRAAIGDAVRGLAPAIVLLGVLGCGAGGEAVVSEAGDEGTFNRAGFRLIEGSEAGGFWRRIEDRSGRALELPEPPRQIVSQTLASDEILLELLPDERLRAVSELALDPRYSLAVEAARRVPETVLHDTERLLSLRPDLLVVASYTTPETLRQLENAGAPVLRLRRFDSIAAIRDNVRTLGFALGEEQTAAALVASMDRRIEAERRRVAAALQGTPRVVSWDGAVAPGLGTTFDDIVGRLGAENPASAAGLDGWPRVGAEQILAWDPDAVFVSAAAGEEETARRRLLEDPRLAPSTAVKLGAVHAIDAALFSTVSHHVAELVEAIGECLAPRVERAP